MSLFDSVVAGMPKAEPKKPAVPMVALAQCDSMEELGEKLETVKSQKKYVSFLSVYRALGKKDKFRPNAIPVILHAVAEIDPGLQALIVNERGQHAEKVAKTHRATLKGYGYSKYPEVKAGKKKAAAEAQEVI